jgi:predicted metal-dependent HD superfamily phosphohydrolase
MDLKENFIQLCRSFSEEQQLINGPWLEIKKKYSEKGRYYHNIHHLENMFLELENVKDQISNFPALSFSVFYHDIIYDASSKRNEEKSAEFAAIRLQKLNAGTSITASVTAQIIATKAHLLSDDNDTNYLLDADLSILGKDAETYQSYIKNIRKEYSIYPDFLYKPGRKKVLLHFLELDHIFKTEYFKDQYEISARKNIKFELDNL